VRPPGSAQSEIGLDFVWAFQMVRRRLWLAVGITVGLTALVAVAVGLLPDRWTAEALVVLNARPAKIASLQSPTESLLSRTDADLSVVRTETEIITSDGLLRTTAERLGLATNAAFAGTGQGDGLLGRITSSLGRSSQDNSREETTALSRAVEQLGRSVEVVNEGGSYAIRIRAQSRDPELSAKIANTLAEVYLESQQAEQSTARKAASDWLAARLRELRGATLAADNALEQYRSTHQLGRADRPSLIETMLAQVNAELVRANTRLARARANLAEAEAVQRKQDDVAAANSVLASPTIQTLREQEAEILVRRGALMKQYGPRYPEVASIDAELEAIGAKLNLEVRRIIAGMRSEVNATRGEVENLERQLAQLEERIAGQSAAQVELADLEREAQASREVYGQFLEQFNATLAQEAGQQPDARLVAPARPPLEPSAPRRKLLVAGAAVGAGGLGVLTALLLGFLRGGFGGPRPLEEATGLPVLEIVPELDRRQLAELFGPATTGAASPIRGLAFALQARLAPGRGRALLLTSSVPGEGKSLLALGLGRAAALSGRRVIVVELDFWRPSLTQLASSLPLEPCGRSLAGSPIRIDRTSGLAIACADLPPPEAERSAAVRELLTALDPLREAYDLILLDAPPVLSVPDVLPAAAEADGTLLVVRFEGPDRDTVQTSLERLAGAGASILGTVLSRVKPRHYRRYGYRVLPYSLAS
jgi:succinoglycan biosynthesis transport protein ExoP